MGRCTTRPTVAAFSGNKGEEDLQPVLDGTGPILGLGLGGEQLLGQGYRFGVDHDNLSASLLGCGYAPMPGRGGFFRGPSTRGVRPFQSQDNVARVRLEALERF